MDKPDALRLVDVPLALRDNLWHTQAEHVLLKLQANNNQLSAQRDALLEALKAAEPYLRHADVDYNVYVQCRAAIKAVEEAG